MPERSDRQGVKSKDHHHTCPEAEDHHCPECCSCECCSRHSRSYETHRRYSHNRPIYPWEPDYIRPKDQYRMGGESEAEQWQRLREEREASLREDFERPPQQNVMRRKYHVSELRTCPECGSCSRLWSRAGFQNHLDEHERERERELERERENIRRELESQKKRLQEQYWDT